MERLLSWEINSIKQHITPCANNMFIHYRNHMSRSCKIYKTEPSTTYSLLSRLKFTHTFLFLFDSQQSELIYIIQLKNINFICHSVTFCIYYIT